MNDDDANEAGDENDDDDNDDDKDDEAEDGKEGNVGRVSWAKPIAEVERKQSTCPKTLGNCVFACKQSSAEEDTPPRPYGAEAAPCDVNRGSGGGAN